MKLAWSKDQRPQRGLEIGEWGEEDETEPGGRDECTVDP